MNRRVSTRLFGFCLAFGASVVSLNAQQQPQQTTQKPTAQKPSTQKPAGQDATQTGSSGAETKGKTVTPKITYDHLKDGENRIFTADVGRYESFVVRVLNTCPDDFEYGVTAVKRPEAEKAARAIDELKPLSAKDVVITYEPQYSGYIIRIQPKGGGVKPSSCYASADPNAEDKTTRAALKEVSLTIAINEGHWDVSMAGAFTVSGLTSDVYSLEAIPNSQDKTIASDPKQKDSVALGLASFIHVYHSSYPKLAPMFGIGIVDEGQPAYYLGVGYRFGDKATLNVGLAAGPVGRLPAGLKVGSVTSDANALTDLRTRIGLSWFVGFSFTFIEVGPRIKKPFALAEDETTGGQGAAASAGAGGGGGGGGGAACIEALAPDTAEITFAKTDKDESTAKVVTVKSKASCEWAVKVNKGGDWLAAVQAPDKKSFKVFATKAIGAQAREAEVHVLIGDDETVFKKITVKQPTTEASPLLTIGRFVSLRR